VVVTATDGKKLVEYRHPAGPEAMPSMLRARMQTAPNGAHSAIVDAEAFRKALAGRDQTAGDSEHEAYALLALSEKIATAGRLQKRDAGPVIADVPVIDATFPKVDAIWPTGEAWYSVAVSPEHLATVAETFAKMGAVSMRMMFRRQEGPIEFAANTTRPEKANKRSDTIQADDGGTLRAVLMPMTDRDLPRQVNPLDATKCARDAVKVAISLKRHLWTMVREVEAGGADVPETLKNAATMAHNALQDSSSIILDVTEDVTRTE